MLAQPGYGKDYHTLPVGSGTDYASSAALSVNVKMTPLKVSPVPPAGGVTGPLSVTPAGLVTPAQLSPRKRLIDSSGTFAAPPKVVRTAVGVSGDYYQHGEYRTHLLQSLLHVLATCTCTCRCTCTCTCICLTAPLTFCWCMLVRVLYVHL